MTSAPIHRRDAIGLRHEWIFASVAAGVALLTIVALEALAAEKLILVIGLVVAPLLAYALCKQPLRFATPLALFLVYTNTPGVLAQFHGVPYTVAGAMPGLLLIPIAYHLSRGEKIVLPAISTWILALVVVQATGAIFARDPQVSIDWFGRSFVEGVVLFLLIVNAVRTPQALRGALWATVAAGAFMGAATAHQYVTSSFHNNYGGFAQTEERGFSTESSRGKTRHARAMGPIGEQNRFAQTMLMLLPLGLFGSIAESSRRRRVLLWLGSCLTAVGCALAFSRGAVVAMALTLIIATLLGHLRLRHFMLMSVACLLLLTLLPQYRERMTSLLMVEQLLSQRGTAAYEPDGSLRGRATEMLAASRVFADHPVVGVGPGMFKYYARQYGLSGGYRALEGRRQAHNLYLGIAAEHGVLGLTCFLAIVVVTLTNLHRVRRRCLPDHPQLANIATGCSMALLAYLSTGMFLHFSYVRYFWALLALATAAHCVICRTLQEAADRKTQVSVA